MSATKRRGARTRLSGPDANPAEPALNWPGDPETVTAADIDFRAVARVLANTCRHGGRIAAYHSLAGHAVLTSAEVEALDGLAAEDRRVLALHALLADAPCVWIGAWRLGAPAGSQRAAERANRLAARIERAVREAADVVAFHRPYKRLGVEKGDELRVAHVDHKARTANLAGKDGETVPWEPERLAARTGGVEVYRGEDMELRAGDRIRWTRNDAGLGLVNSETAEVAGVKNGVVTFRLEDGRRIDLCPGDPQLRHIDRAWASTVHAFQGRTVDTVIAAMEAKHPNLTTQQMLYVEISRARDRAELVTDDRAGLREQLEAVTGERIAALEAVGPEDERAKAKTRETSDEAGRGADRGAETARKQERRTQPDMEQAREPKGVERDMGL